MEYGRDPANRFTSAQKNNDQRINPYVQIYTNSVIHTKDHCINIGSVYLL